MALVTEVAYLLGFALVVIGLLVIVASLIFISRRRNHSEGKTEVQGVGVIMIGPIPIIFGTDKKSVKKVLVMALALTFVILIMTFVYYWWLR